MALRFQFFGATAAELASKNPVLLARELVVEVDTNKHKIGDGITSWNSLPYGGTKGDQGVKGDTGIQGSTGPKGDKGDTGVTGLQGPTGADSTVPGPQGPKGDPGDVGPQGPQGVAGPKGDTGATGPAGVKGDTGLQGIQGLPGNDGAPGAQGSQGLKGDTGNQGPQGIQGQIGQTGPPGTTDYNALENKPSLATVATSGAYADLSGKPNIPAAQVQTDWNAVSGIGVLLNKPNIPAAQVNSDWNSVSGLSQILNKPAIPALPLVVATPATTGIMTVPMTSTGKTITPTGACTFNASGGTAGTYCTFIITTSGTAAFVLTFSTNFKAAGTLSTGTVSGKKFSITFFCIDGTLWQEIGRTAAM